MIPINKVSFNYTPIGSVTNLRAALVMGRIMKIDPDLPLNPIRYAQIQRHLRAEIWGDVYGDLELPIQELSTIAIRVANDGGELARVQYLTSELKKLLKMPEAP